MKNKLARFVLYASKFDRSHIQLFILIISLTILVLGIGAPSDVGGGGH